MKSFIRLAVIAVTVLALVACRRSPGTRVSPAWPNPPPETSRPFATPADTVPRQVVAELEKRVAAERELRLTTETRLAAKEIQKSRWQSAALLAVAVALVFVDRRHDPRNPRPP
ncbi:MAG: hypothetical protein QOE70_1621 [Chthoniobacter sp.]|jgi:Pyruvate/2-oxoacid:ferredoxin oxidoreductase gamma subunit|nr:hypothetical protein [Chthoniobacter sp.]